MEAKVLNKVVLRRITVSKVRDGLKEKEVVKVMYESMYSIDVITSISRLPVNVASERQKTSFRVTKQHTKGGLAEEYTYSHLHTFSQADESLTTFCLISKPFSICSIYSSPPSLPHPSTHFSSSCQGFYHFQKKKGSIFL